MNQLDLFAVEERGRAETQKNGPVNDGAVSLLVEAQKTAVASDVESQNAIQSDTSIPILGNSPHCVKCGKQATLFSPRQTPYCVEHGTCGHCGESVEYFVPHDVAGVPIYLCPCVVQAIRDNDKWQVQFDREKARKRLRLLR